MSPYKLYSNPASGNSYKIRLLASLLNIDLPTTNIDFLKDEQHSPSFLAINPRGEIPTLVVDDKTVLCDSSGILVYLAGKHPSGKYWSTDILEQARITDWLAFANSWVQYGVFTARAMLSFGGAYNGLGFTGCEQTYKDAVTRSYKSLDILETRLKERDWLALDRPTVADVAVFVYVALSPMGDVVHDGHPGVKAWVERVGKLDGFVKMDGLDDPFYMRRSGEENTHASVRHLAKKVPA